MIRLSLKNLLFCEVRTKKKQNYKIEINLITNNLNVKIKIILF